MVGLSLILFNRSFRFRANFGEGIDTQEGDEAGLGDTHLEMGNVALMQLDFEKAIAHYETSLAIRKKLGDIGGMAQALGNLAQVAQYQQDFVSAKSYYEQILYMLGNADHELGNKYRKVHRVVELSFGELLLMQGDLDEARFYLEEALEQIKEDGLRRDVARAHRHLGTLCREEEGFVAAHQHYCKAISIYSEIDDQLELSEVFSLMAWLSVAQIDRQRAICLYAVAATLSGENPPRFWYRFLGEQLAAIMADVRKQLPTAEVEALEQKGAAMSLEEAIAYASRTDVITADPHFQNNG